MALQKPWVQYCVCKLPSEISPFRTNQFLLHEKLGEWTYLIVPINFVFPDSCVLVLTLYLLLEMPRSFINDASGLSFHLST